MLEGLVLKIKMQAGAEGKLFGSVGTVDIAEEIGKRAIEVERSEVRLPDGPLRVASGDAGGLGDRLGLVRGPVGAGAR